MLACCYVVAGQNDGIITSDIDKNFLEYTI